MLVDYETRATTKIVSDNLSVQNLNKFASTPMSIPSEIGKPRVQSYKDQGRQSIVNSVFTNDSMYTEPITPHTLMSNNKTERGKSVRLTTDHIKS